tara:strand:+ start:108 stop:608 length:501 start_codon:yes stop_codon:yes gene_type:complete
MFKYDQSNPYHQSMLHFAIHWFNDSFGDDIDNFLGFINNIINYDQSVINKQDIFGLTALHYAVEYDYIELGELLLRRGASVRVKDIYGDNPLHVSMRYYSRNPCHHAFCELLKFHSRIIKAKNIIRFIGKLMCLYRDTVERIYVPNGVGYEECKKHFNCLLLNEPE